MVINMKMNIKHLLTFRELFISVPLISKTFSQKQKSLNDALDSILEKIKAIHMMCLN